MPAKKPLKILENKKEKSRLTAENTNAKNSNLIETEKSNSPIDCSGDQNITNIESRTQRPSEEKNNGRSFFFFLI